MEVCRVSFLRRATHFSCPKFWTFNSQQDKDDAQVSSLEERIKALEVGATYDATQTQIKQVELEFLEKLRDIRSAIANAEQGAVRVSDDRVVKTLQQENKALKERNAKLEYRIKHVVAEMERLYEEKKSLHASAGSSMTDIAEF